MTKRLRSKTRRIRQELSRSIPYEALRLQKVGLDGAGFVDVKKMYMIKTADSFQPIPGCMAVKRIAKDDYYFSIDLTTKNGRECAANMVSLRSYFR